MTSREAGGDDSALRLVCGRRALTSVLRESLDQNERVLEIYTWSEMKMK